MGALMHDASMATESSSPIEALDMGSRHVDTNTHGAMMSFK
jgi:hypothetical protein